MQIAIEFDNTNTAIEIHQVDMIGIVPKLYTFFMRQLADLIDIGYALPNLTYTDNDGAVYAMIDDKIVGAIVYTLGGPSHRNGSASITLSTVDNDFRKRGIYSVLYKHFEIVLKQLDVKVVTGMVHTENKAGLDSAMKMGRVHIFNYMVKNI